MATDEKTSLMGVGGRKVDGGEQKREVKATGIWFMCRRSKLFTARNLWVWIKSHP